LRPPLSGSTATTRYTIDYRAIQYRYTPINPDGTTSGDIVVQWDQTTGETTIIDNSNGGSLVFLTGDSALLPPEVNLPGDYNQNGIVDAADYTVYRNNEGTTNVLVNDPIGGTIGPAQYALWKARFGQTAGSGSGLTLPSAESLSPAVPEPKTLVLLFAAASWFLLQRRTA